MISRVLPISMAPTVAISALAPARKVMMSGERVSRLIMNISARAASENKRVLFLCGDNRFDPYAVAHFAKALGERAEDILRSILVARAFTAYQLVELVDRLDPDPSRDFVVISGPCSTFFDEDVPLIDAARLFYRVLWRMVELARSGLSLLIAQGHAAAGARRAYFLADLCRISEVVLRISGERSFTLEHHARPMLPVMNQEP